MSLTTQFSWILQRPHPTPEPSQTSAFRHLNNNPRSSQTISKTPVGKFQNPPASLTPIMAPSHSTASHSITFPEAGERFNNNLKMPAPRDFDDSSGQLVTCITTFQGPPTLPHPSPHNVYLTPAVPMAGSDTPTMVTYHSARFPAPMGPPRTAPSDPMTSLRPVS